MEVIRGSGGPWGGRPWRSSDPRPSWSRSRFSSVEVICGRDATFPLIGIAGRVADQDLGVGAAACVTHVDLRAAEQAVLLSHAGVGESTDAVASQRIPVETRAPHLEYVRRRLERIRVALLELVGVKAIHLNSFPPINELVV